MDTRSSIYILHVCVVVRFELHVCMAVVKVPRLRCCPHHPQNSIPSLLPVFFSIISCLLTASHTTPDYETMTERPLRGPWPCSPLIERNGPAVRALILQARVGALILQVRLRDLILQVQARPDPTSSSTRPNPERSCARPVQASSECAPRSTKLQCTPSSPRIRQDRTLIPLNLTRPQTVRCHVHFVPDVTNCRHAARRFGVFQGGHTFESQCTWCDGYDEPRRCRKHGSTCNTGLLCAFAREQVGCNGLSAWACHVRDQRMVQVHYLQLLTFMIMLTTAFFVIYRVGVSCATPEIWWSCSPA